MKKILKCAGCSVEFVQKHGNRRFHSDKCCDDFHNNRQRKIRKEISGIEVPLKKNFKILKAILKNSKSVTKSRDYLDGAGLDFHYYTSVSFEQSGSNIWVIYTICIIELPGNTFKIEKYEKDQTC